MVVVAESLLDLRVGPAEAAAARRQLRDQIAKLELELAETLQSAFPRVGVDVAVEGLSGPRVLGLADLEQLRDRLGHQLGEARKKLGERGEEEAEAHELLERMLLEPHKHKFRTLRASDLGGKGCGVYRVRPRYGLIGMLAGWWHVKLSSGCPLATAAP